MNVEEKQAGRMALAKAMAAKGVPPFLVASNIKEPEYTSVHLWKENGCIFVRSICQDEESGELQFLYSYDETVTLQKIEMTVAGRTSVYYDRQQEIGQLAEAVGYHPVCEAGQTIEGRIRQLFGLATA